MKISKTLKTQSNLIQKGLLFVTLSMLIAACGGTQKTVDSFIKIKPEATSNFTTSSLQRFVTQNEGASVVVRDFKAAKANGLSGDSQSSTLCALLESALLKADYNVRDRQIFENVVNKMGDNVDYEQLQKKTGTDLIFEIIDWGYDKYNVRDYYTTVVKKGEKREQKYSFYDRLNKKQKIEEDRDFHYTFSGYHIEIKVIMLRENKLGGTYKYYYTPCDVNGGGCKITKFGPPVMRYHDMCCHDEENRKDYEKSPQRVAGDNEEIIQDWSSFISKIVRSMDEEIKQGK